MASLFNSIPMRRPKSNFFDLSHEVKTTCNMGDLVPIYCEPVVPGDKFKLQTELLVRLAPTLAPIMHRVNVYTHFFFVPNRLVWDNWEKFITRGATGTLTPKYPTISVASFAESDYNLVGNGSLFDYLGFQPFKPTSSTKGEVDALPFRAYQLIYDEFYRDQTLVKPICRNVASQECDERPDGVPFGDGICTTTSWRKELLSLRQRAWEKDYFTSALTSPQRGADVSLPIAGSANVVLSDLDPLVAGSYPLYRDAVSRLPADGSVTADGVDGITRVDNNPTIFDPNGSLKADLSSASSTTVNELRRSIKLQEFLEKTARGGSRYIEQILSHFGVRSSDARLQRPEYLGGGMSPIIISEVIQQSASNSDSPQGNLSGHGVSAQVTHQFKRFFEEHGFIIGIMSIMPKPAYMTGTPRKYLKRDFFDFYWPEFANLGEQAIVNEELYANYELGVGHGIDYVGEKNKNDEIFGYTPRYAEYKHSPSTAHGDFRGNLDFWHMTRKFDKLPTLSKEFIYERPTTRIFPVTDNYTHHLWVQCYHNVKAKRPMPKFGVPSF